MSELQSNNEQQEVSKTQKLIDRLRSYFVGKDTSKSRRRFLQGAAGVAATVALGGSFASTELRQLPAEEPQTSTQEKKEVEQPIQPLIIDTFNGDAFFDKIIREELLPRGIDVQAILDKYGLNDASEVQDFAKVLPENDKEVIALLIMAGKAHQNEHGQRVSSVWEKTAQYLGTSKPEFQEADNTDTSGFVSFEKDELGNHTFLTQPNFDYYDTILSQSDQSLVNISSELGKVGLTLKLYRSVKTHPEIRLPGTVQIGDTIHYRDYSGNDITKEQYDEIERLAAETKIELAENPVDRSIVYRDGYVGEQAYENLKPMVELAKKHPDKIIMAAAGNRFQLFDIPDLREARKRLEAEGGWPQNLFLIGYINEEQGFLAPAEYGADFYIKESDTINLIDEKISSSFTTPMVTEIVRRLMMQGIKDPTEIRQALTDLSVNINSPDYPIYMHDKGDDPYYMIDLDKVKRAYNPINTGEVKAE